MVALSKREIDFMKAAPLSFSGTVSACLLTFDWLLKDSVAGFLGS